MKSLWNKFGKFGLSCLLVLTFAGAVLATGPTALSVITPLGPTIVGQPASNSLNFAFTACDNTNGNSFTITGREILLVQNTDTMAAHTFTLTSVPDVLGRSQDVTAYSVPESDFAAFNFRGGVPGWKNATDGTVHMTCSANTISFAVITSPN